MEVQVTTRHVKISDSMTEIIDEKLAKIGKFYEKITSCHVIFDSERSDKTVEIVLTIMGGTLTAKAKSDNVRKSFEGAIAKLERQLKRTNEKVKNHKPAKIEV